VTQRDSQEDSLEFISVNVFGSVFDVTMPLAEELYLKEISAG